MLSQVRQLVLERSCAEAEVKEVRAQLEMERRQNLETRENLTERATAAQKQLEDLLYNERRLAEQNRSGQDLKCLSLRALL